jgi:hypothetical protein
MSCTLKIMIKIHPSQGFIYLTPSGPSSVCAARVSFVGRTLTSRVSENKIIILGNLGVFRGIEHMYENIDKPRDWRDDSVEA